MCLLSRQVSLCPATKLGSSLSSGYQFRSLFCLFVRRPSPSRLFEKSVDERRIAEPRPLPSVLSLSLPRDFVRSALYSALSVATALTKAAIVSSVCVLACVSDGTSFSLSLPPPFHTFARNNNNCRPGDFMAAVFENTPLFSSSSSKAPRFPATDLGWSWLCAGREKDLQ